MCNYIHTYWCNSFSHSSIQGGGNIFRSAPSNMCNLSHRTELSFRLRPSIVSDGSWSRICGGLVRVRRFGAQFSASQSYVPQYFQVNPLSLGRLIACVDIAHRDAYPFMCAAVVARRTRHACFDCDGRRLNIRCSMDDMMYTYIYVSTL